MIAHFFHPTKENFPGLLFHSIGSPQPLSLSTVSPKRFRAILQALRVNGFSPVTLADAVREQVPRERAMVLSFDDGCESFFRCALPALEEHGFKAALFPVAGYLGKSSSWDVLSQFRHLTREQLREIAACGHEIGSHSMNHSDLTLLRPEELHRELRDSKHLLEDIIGREVASISFPFGSWNEHVWEAAREAGYGRATIYRRHGLVRRELFPVYGVYRFDRVKDILERLDTRRRMSLSIARARIMSHFSKGSPMWKFDSKRYVLPR